MQNFLGKIKEDDLERLKPVDKAKRTAKKSYLVLSKKRKRKYEPSRVAVAVKEMVKRKINSIDGIKKYFSENYQTVSDSDVKFYNTILETKVINNNIRITDTLTNQPIYSYFSTVNFETRSISNDYLFANLLYYIKKGNNEYYTNTFQVDQVTFCSLPFLCNGEIKKGYYQDFSGTFAAIGFSQSVTANDLDNVLNGNENGEKMVNFEINKKKFTGAYTKQFFLIFLTQTDKEEVKKRFTDMKILSSKNKIVLNDKVIPINNKIRYIDCTVKTQDFCPAFLITPDIINYSLLFRLKYDYNDLFSAIEQNCVQNNQLVFPPNMLYWDTLHQTMDFIGILSIASQNITGNNKYSLATLYDKYIDLKEILDVWKQNQLLYQRVLKEFFTSFNNILNFDKLMMLREKIRNYTDMLGMLKKDETYNEVKDFINECNKFNLCQCMKNQMNDKVFSVAEEMYNVLSRLQESNVSNLVNDLKRVGLAIYYLTYIPGGNSQIMAFPFILSPGSFLGNVINGVKLNESDPLAEIVVNLQNRLVKKENAQNEMLDQIEYITTNKQALQKKVLTQTVKRYLKNKKLNLNDNIKNAIVNSIYPKVNQDRKLEMDLDNIINKTILSGKEINKAVLSEGTIDKYIQDYILALQNQEMKNKQSAIQRNQQINELRRQNLNEEEETIATEKPSHRKLVETMLSLKLGELPEGNPMVLSKWYSDIVRLSGLYNYTDNQYEQMEAMTIDKLIKNIKLAGDMIDVVVADYNLPRLDEVLAQQSYTRSSMLPDKTKKYANQEYLTKRLAEMYGDMIDA